MKRLIAILISMVLLFAMGPSLIAENDPFAVDEEVSIEFWHSMSFEAGVEAIEDILNEFMEAYPNITVTSEYYSASDLKAKVMASAAAGDADAPALTMTSLSGISAFSQAGIIENFSPYMEGSPDFDEDDYYEDFMKALYHDGQYSLPFSNSCAVVYYNKTMFDEAGIEVPEKWDELEDALRAVSKDGVGGIAFNGGDTYNWGFWLWNNGSTILSEDDSEVLINSETSLETLTKIQEWYDDGLVKWFTSGSDAEVAFHEGNVASFMASCSKILSLKETAEASGFELGLAFPVSGSARTSSELGGSGLIMPSSKTQLEKNAAWQLAKWLTNPENNALISTLTGYLPYRISATQTEEYQNFLKENPEVQPLTDNLSNIIPQQTFHKAYSSIRKVISDNITKTLQENLSMQDCLDAIEAGINDYLDD